MASETAPIVYEQEDGLATFSKPQMDILRNTICKGATDAELHFFAQVCKAKRLDPFGQQIFLVKRNGKDGPTLCIQTGIDGFRAQAARTGEYAGNDEPVFEYAGAEQKRPTKATVTVYRFMQGQRVPFIASARWDEFYPGDNLGFMWKTKPHVMLGKCAEAQAIRKAFPNECSGLYEEAELQQQEELPRAATGAQALTERFLPRTEQAADPETIKKVVLGFAELNIPAEAIMEKVGKTLDHQLTKSDLDVLRAWYVEEAAKK